MFGSSTIAAGVFLCLDLLTSPQDRTDAQIQQQRASVEDCIVSLQRNSHKTTICHEGSKTLQQLFDLEIAQQDRPVDQEGLARLIKHMANPSEQASREPTFQDHGHSFWQPLMVDQTSSLMGHEDPSLPMLSSSAAPGMLSGCYQPDPYWLLDSIIFPEYWSPSSSYERN